MKLRLVTLTGETLDGEIRVEEMVATNPMTPKDISSRSYQLRYALRAALRDGPLRCREMKKRLLVLGLLMFVGAGLGFLLFISGSHALIERSSEGRVFVDGVDISDTRVGLVLGCSRYLPNGRENLYFRYRIEKARELFVTGKVKYLIVSGDNSRVDYDEPTEMKGALVERGIPEQAIYCDYAGFSTLDSVVRAKAIFQQSELVVISQEFHIKRAIYIGESRGVDLVGFVARDVDGAGGMKTKLREYLARVKTVLDLHLLGRQPVYFGEAVVIG